MIKYIYNIIILAGIVFILDFAIGKTLRHFYFKQISGFEYCITHAVDSTKADITVFGASRAKYHYVPEFFEDSLKMSFYNCGNDGDATFYQLAVLKAVLKRHTPKIIIMDYKEDLDKGNGGYNEISFLLPYYKTHKEIRGIVGIKSPYEKIKLLSQIYPFNSKIISIPVNNLKSSIKKNADDEGYVPKYGEWQFPIDTIRNKAYPIDSVKLNAVGEFIQTAQKAGAEVFIIYSPIYERYSSEPEEIAICRKTCMHYGVPFWDFSQDTVFLNHNRLFFDTHHLNPEGAAIFSKMVAHKIKEYISAGSGVNLR